MITTFLESPAVVIVTTAVPLPVAPTVTTSNPVELSVVSKVAAVVTVKSIVAPVVSAVLISSETRLAAAAAVETDTAWPITVKVSTEATATLSKLASSELRTVTVVAVVESKPLPEKAARGKLIDPETGLKVKAWVTTAKAAKSALLGVPKPVAWVTEAREVRISAGAAKVTAPLVSAKAPKLIAASAVIPIIPPSVRPAKWDCPEEITSTEPAVSKSLVKKVVVAAPVYVKAPVTASKLLTVTVPPFWASIVKVATVPSWPETIDEALAAVNDTKETLPKSIEVAAGKLNTPAAPPPILASPVITTLVKLTEVTVAASVASIIKSPAIEANWE